MTHIKCASPKYYSSAVRSLESDAQGIAEHHVLLSPEKKMTLWKRHRDYGVLEFQLMES